MASVIDEQLNEMDTKILTLDQRDDDNKPIGSRWRIASIDKSCIGIFENKTIKRIIIYSNP